MEIIKSQRGFDKLCYGGFTYTRKKASKSTITWECSRRRTRQCTGVVITDLEISRLQWAVPSPLYSATYVNGHFRRAQQPRTENNEVPAIFMQRVPPRQTGAHWDWVKNVEYTDNITDEHIRIVYRINQAPCAIPSCVTTCKSNPSCINGLTEINLSEDGDSSIETTSHDSVRFIGFKNYGGTCYLNSFLQLYYRFGRLRRTVYSLNSCADETGVIQQLQLIFAQLQLALSRIVDPGGLIEALQLSEDEQQDAPEFHCLFLNLLETKFREAGLSSIDNLFRGEIVYQTSCLGCGFVSRFPSNFTDLPLKVSSNSLLNCINEYFKSEQLEGDNRYACPSCKAKQDGCRSVAITRAPSVLCLQLLRFTYDPRSGQRKKQRGLVRIPETLELTACDVKGSSSEPSLDRVRIACMTSSSRSDVADNSTDQQPAPPQEQHTYRLCGILLHIGSQPTSGHYIAVVRGVDQTPSANTWTIFNDSEVVTISESQFDLSKVGVTNNPVKNNSSKTSSTDQPTPPKVSSPSASKRRKYASDSMPPSLDFNVLDVVNGPSSSQQQSENPELNEPTRPKLNKTHSQLQHQSLKWHTSTSAYMLFYESLSADSSVDADITVPDHLRQLVIDLNSKEINESEIQRQIEMTTSSELRHLVDGLSLAPFHPLDLNQVALVPTKWLSSWLSDPLSSVPPAIRIVQPQSTTVLLNGVTTTDQSSSSEQQDDVVSHTTCPHGRFPLSLGVDSYRAVVASFLEQRLLAGNDADECERKQRLDDLPYFKPCPTCIYFNTALIHLENAITAITKRIDQFARIQTNLGAIRKFCNQPTSSQSDKRQPRFYWIGKHSLQQWRKLARTYARNSFLLQPLTSPLPSQVATPFNTDLLCQHNQLQTSDLTRLRLVPASIWYQLTALFARANLPTFSLTDEQHDSLLEQQSTPSSFDQLVSWLVELQQPCHQCQSIEQGLVSRAEREADQLINLLTADWTKRRQSLLGLSSDSTWLVQQSSSLVKSSSSSWFETIDLTESSPVKASPSEHQQPTALVNNINSSSVAQDPNLCVYLVPTSFVTKWRRFVRNPSSRTLPDRALFTSTPTLSDVVCQHNRLRTHWSNLVSGDTSSQLVPLSAYEWSILSTLYAPSSEDVDSFPTLHLVPPSSSSNGHREDGWQLRPSDWAAPCEVCSSVDSDDDDDCSGAFRRARLLVRLASSMDEALAASLSIENQLCETSSDKESCVTQPSSDSNSKSTTTSASNIPNSPTPLPPSYKPPTSPVLRRSARQRIQSSDHTLTVTGSDQTLLDVKIKLMHLVGVTPADQHIFYKGQELTDGDKSLQQLQVKPNSILYLWSDGQAFDPTIDNGASLLKGASNGESLADATAYSRPAGRGFSDVTAAPIEVGFKGTRLLQN